MTKYLFKTESNCSGIVEKVSETSVAVQLKVLKLWGPWKEYDPKTEVGGLTWIPKQQFEEDLKDGTLTEVTPENQKEYETSKLVEPEVSNTNPPKDLQKTEKIQQNNVKTTIFTPFKFTHTKDSAHFFDSREGFPEIGKVNRVITLVNMRTLKPETAFYIIILKSEREYVIDEDNFEQLKPVFFDDFEYPLPEEKKDGGYDNPPGV